VILLSLAGTFYMTLLMGLLIGRFIATAELELELEAIEDELDGLAAGPVEARPGDPGGRVSNPPRA
jgi:hypothetical protein